MQTISNVNSVNKWSTQLSEIKPCSIHSPFYPNKERKLSHNKFTRYKITKSQNRVHLKTRWMCVSCPVNRCSSRNIPCKRREHILLDRQSGLFVLDQLHCQIVKAYVAHSVGEILCSLRTPPMLVLDQFLPRTKKSANSGEKDLHFSRNQSHNGQRQMWSGNLKQPNWRRLSSCQLCCSLAHLLLTYWNIRTQVTSQ